MTITMTPEQVKAAIAGYDLKTFKGWTSAAVALLADKPAGTALRDEKWGFVALIEGILCPFPANRDGSLTVSTENGFPEGGWESGESVWTDLGCWEGSTPEHDARLLTDPVFVTLTFVEA